MRVNAYLGLGLGIAIGLVGCASQLGGLSATLISVPIYRGVDANNSGRAALSPSQFRFNTELSTFDVPASAPVQKACNYRFFVTGMPSPPPVGASGPVQGLPAGYVATFDNNPPGHWSIAPPAGTPPAAAEITVSQFAQGDRNDVVNGTQTNCH